MILRFFVLCLLGNSAVLHLPKRPFCEKIRIIADINLGAHQTSHVDSLAQMIDKIIENGPLSHHGSVNHLVIAGNLIDFESFPLDTEPLQPSHMLNALLKQESMISYWPWEKHKGYIDDLLTAGRALSCFINSGRNVTWVPGSKEDFVNQALVDYFSPYPGYVSVATDGVFSHMGLAVYSGHQFDAFARDSDGRRSVEYYLNRIIVSRQNDSVLNREYLVTHSVLQQQIEQLHYSVSLSSIYFQDPANMYQLLIDFFLAANAGEEIPLDTVVVKGDWEALVDIHGHFRRKDTGEEVRDVTLREVLEELTNLIQRQAVHGGNERTTNLLKTTAYHDFEIYYVSDLDSPDVIVTGHTNTDVSQVCCDNLYAVYPSGWSEVRTPASDNFPSANRTFVDVYFGPDSKNSIRPVQAEVYHYLRDGTSYLSKPVWTRDHLETRFWFGIVVGLGGLVTLTCVVVALVLHFSPSGQLDRKNSEKRSKYPRKNKLKGSFWAADGKPKKEQENKKSEKSKLPANLSKEIDAANNPMDILREPLFELKYGSKNTFPEENVPFSNEQQPQQKKIGKLELPTQPDVGRAVGSGDFDENEEKNNVPELGNSPSDVWLTDNSLKQKFHTMQSPREFGPLTAEFLSIGPFDIKTVPDAGSANEIINRLNSNQSLDRRQKDKLILREVSQYFKNKKAQRRNVQNLQF